MAQPNSSHMDAATKRDLRRTSNPHPNFPFGGGGVPARSHPAPPPSIYQHQPHPLPLRPTSRSSSSASKPSPTYRTHAHASLEPFYTYAQGQRVSSHPQIPHPASASTSGCAPSQAVNANHFSGLPLPPHLSHLPAPVPLPVSTPAPNAQASQQWTSTLMSMSSMQHPIMTPDGQILSPAQVQQLMNAAQHHIAQSRARTASASSSVQAQGAQGEALVLAQATNSGIQGQAPGAQGSSVIVEHGYRPSSAASSRPSSRPSTSTGWAKAPTLSSSSAMTPPTHHQVQQQQGQQQQQQQPQAGPSQPNAQMPGQPVRRASMPTHFIGQAHHQSPAQPGSSSGTTYASSSSSSAHRAVPSMQRTTSSSNRGVMAPPTEPGVIQPQPQEPRPQASSSSSTNAASSSTSTSASALQSQQQQLKLPAIPYDSSTKLYARAHLRGVKLFDSARMHLLQALDTHRSQVEAAYMGALVASEGEFARLEARGLGALQMLQQTQAELAQARAALGQTQAQVTREREERRKDSEKLKAEAIVQAKAEMKAEREREKEKEREERKAAVAQRDEARREKDDACVRAAKEQSEKEVAMSMNTLLRRRTQELGREVERLNKEIALLGMPGQHPGLIQQLQHDDKRGVLMHEVAVEEDRKEVDLKAPSKLVTAELLEEWRITVTKDWEERMLAVIRENQKLILDREEAENAAKTTAAEVGQLKTELAKTQAVLVAVAQQQQQQQQQQMQQSITPMTANGTAEGSSNGYPSSTTTARAPEMDYIDLTGFPDDDDEPAPAISHSLYPAQNSTPAQVQVKIERDEDVRLTVRLTSLGKRRRLSSPIDALTSVDAQFATNIQDPPPTPPSRPRTVAPVVRLHSAPPIAFKVEELSPNGNEDHEMGDADVPPRSSTAGDSTITTGTTNPPNGYAQPQSRTASTSYVLATPAPLSAMSSMPATSAYVPSHMDVDIPTQDIPQPEPIVMASSQATDTTDDTEASDDFEAEPEADVPIKLSMRHIPLAYEELDGRLRCRMCSFRHNADSSVPHTDFAKDAAWTVISGHLIETHESGARKLAMMSPAQVEEHRIKYTSDGSAGIGRR